MDKKTIKPFLILLFVLAVLALLFGLWTHHNTRNSLKNTPENSNIVTATVLPQPKSIIDFYLTDDHNKAFTNANLQKHWTFVFFGFTHCPQLCPTTLAVLNKMYQQLVQNQANPLPQILFVSVDPDRDSPEQIHKYLQSFNPDFMGVTGTKDQIDGLTEQFNVMYAKVFADGDQSHYMIDHSGTILLLNPKGQLYAIFSTPHDASAIAKDYLKIVSNN
jgi:protein SCO1/2